EAKDYRHFEWDWNRPPTLEEDIVQSLNTSDVTAGRMTIERQLGDHSNNLVRVSFLEGWDGKVLTQIHHGVVGGRFIGPSDIEIEWRAGYRWLPSYENVSHGLLKAKIKTGKGQAIELGYRKYYHNYGLNLISVLDDQNRFDVSYVFSEKWNISFGYEF